MKKSKLFRLVVLVLIMVTAFAACSSPDAPVDDPVDEPPVDNVDTPSNDEGKLVMGLDDSFPPMGFRDENNEIVGFDVDMAKEVASRLGLELVLQPIDWSTKELELNAGNIDVIWNGLSVNDERKETMLLSPAYLDNAQIVVVKKDSGITSLDDLADKIIGIQEGSSAEGAWQGCDMAGSESELVLSKDNVTLLVDLGIGRIDAVVMDKVVADYYIATENEELMTLEQALDPEMYSIAFKVGNQELYDKVTAALQEMVDDGTAATISEKWFGENMVVFPKDI